jgi:hypothetical protein
MTENAVLTPYAAAKLVNAQLAEAGLKAIPPQMMYNYTSARIAAGKAPFIKFDAKKGVDRVSLDEWTAKYIAKKLAALTVADEATTTVEA